MRFSKEEKAMWLEDWQQSGKNAWAYAKQNGLIPQTFARWIKLESKPEPGFVEIPANRITSTLNTPKILIEKGDIKIHIPLGMEGKQLRTLIEALRVAV